MIQMNLKRYSPEFKAQAVELVSLRGGVPEVSQELGVGAGILYRWVSEANKSEQIGSEGLAAGGGQAAADELRRLTKENARLKLENDILKKAAIILGSNQQSSGGK